MSSLYLMKKQGIPLPPVESEDGLTAKDIMDKIRSFYRRYEKNDAEFVEADFLDLLRNYPKSMCDRHLTESAKLLIALYYFHNRPEDTEDDPVWKGFSYEDLGIIFDVSKATVFTAIREKKAEAKQLLAEPKLRTKARELALEELKQEEKTKLMKQIT